MTSADALSALLVSDQAEDVKYLTLGIREQYQDSRVEAVYTADQALEWAIRHPWRLIIVDLELPDSSGFALVRKLRERSPEAGIILHSAHRNVSPLQAMRSGATALLHRGTPSFLSDLYAVTDEFTRVASVSPAAGGRGLQYLQLVEAPGVILYELNSGGQFTYVSTTVRAWLGYDTKELLGAHYSKLLHSESRRLAAQRFNERRAGARATRKLELRLVPKPRIGLVPDMLPARVSARGLYAAPAMFLGTVGLIQRDSPTTVTHPHRRENGALAAPHHAVAVREAAPARTASESPSEPLTSLWHAVQHFLGRVDVIAPAPAPVVESTATGLPTLHQDVPASAGQTRSPEPSPMPTPTLVRPGSIPSPPALAPTPASPRPSIPDRPERRQVPRYDVHLQSEVSFSGEVWGGVTTNLSHAGLCVLLPSLPLAIESQTITVSLLSDVLFLQLAGRASTDERAAGTLLRVHFADMEDVKHVVLRSFLEVLRDHPDCLKVQVQIPFLDSGPGRPVRESTSAPTISTSWDRRFDLRTPCQIPVHVVCSTPLGAHTRRAGTLLDVHLRGARLRTQEPLPTQCLDCRLEIQTPSRLWAEDIAAPASRDSPSRVVPFQVVHDVQQRADLPSCVSLNWSYGVRFEQVQDESVDLLGKLVNHAILSHMGTARYRSGRMVASELLFTHNAHDRRITLYHDYAGGENPGLTPIVVISPDLGQTKEEYLHIAYFLATQGFHVLRYDPTNHVGESDGDAARPLLSHLEQDLHAVLAFVDEFWPGTPLLLLGDGIGGRLCARLLRTDRWIVGLALFNLPLDLSEDLHVLQHMPHDPFKTPEPSHMMGHLKGVRVFTEAFVRDAVMSRYVSTQDLMDDLTGITIPISLFASLGDAARQRDVLDQLRATLGPACRSIIFMSEPNSAHLPIPPRPGNWVHKLAQFFMAEARHGQLAPAILSTSESDLLQEHKLERQRLQCLHRWSRADREGHWSAYVTQCQTILHSAAYRKMLESVSLSLTPLNEHQRVLEVGCGMGELADFLLTRRAHHLHHSATALLRLPEYIGLDLSSETLASARARLLTAQNTLSRGGVHTLFGGRALVPLFTQWELDGALPFPSDRFDVVVTNLILGHLSNPLLAIQEYWRVLAPGGRLIVVALKSTAELSRWYQESRLAERDGPAAQTVDPASAQEVLVDFHRGWVEGALHRFTSQELVALLTAAHGVIVSIDAGLDDQVYVAIAQKPRSH